jgi:putative transposase
MHPSRRQQQVRRRIAAVEARAACIRRDQLHKLTSRLVTEHGTVVVERLNVAGMLRNRHLARAINDVGFAQLRRLLAYKAIWRGARLVQADSFFPSRKTCSACGAARATLRLGERTFRCDNDGCGLLLDRDLNAARDLAKLVVGLEAVAPQALNISTVAGVAPRRQTLGERM